MPWIRDHARTYKRARGILAKLRARRSDKPPQSSFRHTKDLPNGAPTFRGTPHREGMKSWLQRLGYTDTVINSLNIIHVAGSKGKGSTCAFIDSFLRSHKRRTGFPGKIGLYTSPHLIDYTERIRINFVPLSKETFAENFFEIWDRLGIRLGPKGPRSLRILAFLSFNPFLKTLAENFFKFCDCLGLHLGDKGPQSLQLLALLSFHTFLKEGVDVAIYETHHGGEFDVTNIIEQPVVTGITSIGRDHVEELGPTIENIAWHKAGIFKEGAIAFSAPQEPKVEQTLRDEATQKNVILRFVDVSQDLTGISIPTQRVNASLAKETAAAWLDSRTPARSLTPQDIRTGIENFTWPGRFQTIRRKNVLWCLDGAHNPMSVGEAARWFDSIPDTGTSTPIQRLLVFALDSDRHNAFETLKSLRDALKGHLSYVIFTSDTNNVDDSRLDNFRLIWKERFPDMKVIKEKQLQNVAGLVRETDAADVRVLVTGSLYLVGDILKDLS